MKITLQQAIEAHLKGIEHLFVPEMRITLIVRHPEDRHASSLWTRDDTDEVIAAIRRLEGDEP